MDWIEPPQMEVGAPEPLIDIEGEVLLCVYRCDNPLFPGWDTGKPPDHPGFDEWFAGLKFEGFSWHEMGEPSDETLAKHELYIKGVSYYSFYQLPIESNTKQKLWVATFHDETLQVIATSAAVVAPRIETYTGEQAMALLKDSIA